MLLLLAALACDKSEPPTSTLVETWPATDSTPSGSDDTEATGTTDTSTGATDDTSTGGTTDTQPTDTTDTTDTVDTAPPPGELLIEQIKTDGSEIGEAALIIGPDGTTVLIDVADAIDAPKVLEAIDHHLAERQIDWVILTHYHSDHVGGFASLFEPSEANGGDPIAVTNAVIHRGPFDLDRRGVHVDQYEEACTLLTSDAWEPARMELCDGKERGSCDLMGAGGPWPVSSCDGVFKGDLVDPSDDGEGNITSIDLGEGATLALFLVNGYLNVEGEPVNSSEGGAPIGYTTIGDENARSIGGFVSHGHFRYVFGGDIPGETPNIEGFIVDNGASIKLPDGTPALPEGSVDILQANHHGFRFATNQAWIDWLAPLDGQTRNMIFGSSFEHDGAPDQGVLDRAAENLGGGWLWVTQLGRGAGEHEQVRCRDRAVVVETADGGDSYLMYDRLADEKGEILSFDSTR